jgi:NADPH2:quinone reductase
VGYYIAAWFAQRPQAAVGALMQLIDNIVSGKVDVQVGRVLPLAEAAAAHRLLEARGSFGKIVLNPW